MAKDTRLINIYLKIHHKRTLTMDDLGYLAAYDPECFEKTCKNVIYKVPEIKSIMEPEAAAPQKEESEQESFEWQSIETLLKNLQRLEINDFPVENMDADKVKSLLGNLYMELLFPHNDQYTFVNMADNGHISLFDKKA
ncbi:hypothetical protein IMSAGC003_01270 [Lachnospiraceae bacterium]|jgi:hypothetical protein|nr:hypothetical protein [Lachnospiraceae bacterium]MCX4272935.1 hypothetical protein [Acetatifactor sp.]GFH94738.1 hypothetical protein IMSAGC003_01270 [Lachnospiraceae bacterium]